MRQTLFVLMLMTAVATASAETRYVDGSVSLSSVDVHHRSEFRIQVQRQGPEIADAMERAEIGVILILDKSSQARG